MQEEIVITVREVQSLYKLMEWNTTVLGDVTSYHKKKESE